MLKPTLLPYFLITLWLAALSLCPTPVSATSPLPPPANDNCTSAMAIAVSGGGYDYGIFNSTPSDMTTATGQAGEFFEFATDYGHTKSVWFQFTISTSRRITIHLETAPGSTLPDPQQSGVTLYAPSGCLPSSGARLGSIISSGELERFCTTAGTYRVQVTAVNTVNASFIVRLEVECPYDPLFPEISIYDCPDKAFFFNAGQPLPQSSSQYTPLHAIDCHSIENQTENACLPVVFRNEFTKSAWYVFTTGSAVDLLTFDFMVPEHTDKVGYRLLEGSVISQPLSSLPVLQCGMTKENSTTRYIEFPCILKPNTTYSLALLFRKDFIYDDLRIRALQRGMAPTGWPKPVLPPANTANQLGVLPLSSTWSDQFDCSSFLSNNVCPPANPASGVIAYNDGGTFNKKLDINTWATFTLATDANVKFNYTFSHSTGEYYTRIFKRTINASCPSPDPGSDMVYAFTGKAGDYKCLTAGDYAIQVLASSNDTFPKALFHKDTWTNGYLGTRFTLRFNVLPLPSVGLFRLDAPGNFDPINNLNPLVDMVTYPSTPAVFVCLNTALPDVLSCPNEEKGMYREVNIGDYNADGVPDEGLLIINTLRTDTLQGRPINYQFLKGDANALATAAGTHDAGELIPGLTDYAGVCIDQYDISVTPPGIDNFCACVTEGIYTLAGYGNVDNVGKGDAPSFTLIISKTVHDSPANVEVIPVANAAGSYFSDADVFSCTNNPGDVPPCGGNQKLVYREFYLADTFVLTVSEIGNSGPFMSLFSGHAADLTAGSIPIVGCFVQSTLLIDPCTPVTPGWYTLVSYGGGPDWSTPVTDPLGYRGDVGRTTRINVTLSPPITPKFNRPEKASQEGITDWYDIPANNPNASTWKVYTFEQETFCLPDTPFIPNQIVPCPGYNRVAFYVFEITKPSFIQIRGVNPSFWTEIYPFDVNAQPGDLLLVPPVYPCVAMDQDTRQVCDLPPGKYTLVIFATDMHYGMSVTPSIYVEEAAQSRFDHPWTAYDFDFIPVTNVFVNGKVGDTNPTYPGQAPSRDKFYCTTGADITDPTETKCGTELNDLVYAAPPGVPKPLFLQDHPPQPGLQPWRTLWYSFKLSGSGVCTLHVEALNGLGYKPFVAVYESLADGNIPWTTLQTYFQSGNDTIIPGLRLIKEKVRADCDAEMGDIIFNKSGCVRIDSRYYVVIGFDAYEDNGFPPNFPNQAINVSVKYDARPTYGAPYDEAAIANEINGLGEPGPPYTNVALGQGDHFVGVDFSLLCYTKNVTDPPGCFMVYSGKSAWFKFDVASHGQLLIALEKIGVANSWLTSDDDISVWRDNGTGPPFTESFPLNPYLDGHEWLSACFDPGTYYLLVRHCSVKIDTIQGYRVHLSLVDSPGDFCSNAIPVNVTDLNPTTGIAIVNCHTIGTDVGEFLPTGNTCFTVPKQKTSWFRVSVSAGPRVDLKFQLAETFTSPLVDLTDVRYRILAGTCGALTPIACSEGNINLTVNCLGPGDYYVQVAMPEKVSSGPNAFDVDGTISLTVTATPSNIQTCSTPLDPFAVNADFSYVSDCQSISFFNQSTAGTDIEYLWIFPDGTSIEDNPVWSVSGTGPYSIMLIVTNIVLQKSDTFSVSVTLASPFAAYVPLADQVICNEETLTLNATYSNATYLWDDNTTKPTRAIQNGGTYWVLMTINGCTLTDSITIDQVHTEGLIEGTHCAGETIVIHGESFDENHTNGIITVAGADPSGCDSILTVQLAFVQKSTYQFSDTICNGDVYTFANQNLSLAGSYLDTLVAFTGCDSIVTLNLAVTPRTTDNHTLSDCVGNQVLLTPGVSGNSYEWDNGSPNDSILVVDAGTYVVSVSDAKGCVISEETFTVAFGVLASPAFAVPPPPCEGEDIVVSASGSSGNYLWFNAPSGGQLLGNTPSLLLPAVHANTTVYVQSYTVGLDTCWSERVPVPVAVIPENIDLVELDTVICEGVSIELPWGEIVQPAANDSFVYTWVSAVTGCDSLLQTVQIQVLDLQAIELPSDVTIELGDSVRLEPVFSFIVDSLYWSPPDWLSCTDCPNPWSIPPKTIEYLLSVWSKEGCLVTAPIRIVVNRDITLYVPNVFSPNGDGINDLFSIYSKKNVGIVNQFAIYDRWGEMLWEAKDFIADGTTGWDGTFRGQHMQPGVFAWVCEVEDLDGGVKRLKGDVMLVR